MEDLTNFNYKKRIIDTYLEEELEGAGAVLIRGPKWCGKTTTAEQLAKSVIYMDKPDEIENNILTASINPSLLLEGPVPRLIDEWQVAPKLWDAVRYTVDRRKLDGQFILTGSSVPLNFDKTIHSGTGRISRITMRPMSLWEAGESSGTVSLSSLFNGIEKIEGYSNKSIEDVAYYICRGGWPRSITQSPKIALRRAYEYIKAVVEVDISKVDGIQKSPARTRLLMRSYARLQGAQAPLTTIRDDMKSNDSSSLSEDTIAVYIDALKKLFVIEDMPAWNPKLRSKTAIRTSDTRYFVDPSLAAASLGVGPDVLIKDLNTMGLLFETMCIRDLRVYVTPLGGEVFHYRDKTGLECDAVLCLNDGSYGLIEIKLGGEKLIKEGAENLKKLASRIDTDVMGAPSFLLVLTATGKYAVRREDGVAVVPLCCLKD